MRFEKGRKDATRRRITEVAAEQFRQNGVAASGLTGIMAAAGLTNGAFYAHFESRDDLVAQSIDHALEEWEHQLTDGVAQAGLEAALRQYLSPEHRDSPGSGCASAALLPEIGRQSLELRGAYTARLNAFVATIAAQIPQDPASAHRTALTIFGLVVGALQLARAVDDPALSASILDGAIQASLRLAAPAETPVS